MKNYELTIMNYEFTITGLMGAAFEILLRVGALGIEAVSFLKINETK
ncbi:hypothetical protein ACFSKN_08435 [Mariniflexile gromovii]|uniref:Uncharacterized protein n=1 Tax=Mariniflexile gromovii TaxID=362523 RepID=A0ABS4BVN6_9FLAO|nr:hypothetical protein [Mariniflexile gromovii]MBP0904122.1 hypothetical protein [Mariniflexile gromovii]